MKKQILILSLLMLLPGALAAQDEPETAPQPKHQVELFIHGPAFGAMMETYYESNEFQTSQLEYLYGTESYFSSYTGLGLSYNYMPHRLWRFGGELTWNRLEATMTPGPARDNHESTTSIQHALAVMPFAKWIIWDDPHCLFYFKAGAGALLSAGAYESTRIRAAYQLIPIGFQIGKRSLTVSFEFGFGNVYTVRGGIGYNF